MTRNQDKDSTGHGGKRAGAGRKPTANPMVKRTATLAEQHWAKAEQIGNGNASAGIRAALEKYSG